MLNRFHKDFKHNKDSKSLWLRNAFLKYDNTDDVKEREEIMKSINKKTGQKWSQYKKPADLGSTKMVKP